MSKFTEIISEHQAEIERMIKQQERGGGTPASYAMFQNMGMLKPFAVRLPVTTLAMLDELQNYGPWPSKQEMVFQMIESAIIEFIESAAEPVQKRFDEVANIAFKEWEKKNGKKPLDLSLLLPVQKPATKLAKPRARKK
ncbi:MAG: hypothetical protein WAO76_12455 [Georgfuchsia sp.]